MSDLVLIPENTAITTNGDGTAVSLNGAAGSNILVSSKITKIVEQESLALSIFGSADGQSWTPLLRFPQQFYVGATPMLLDLSQHSEVKELRAHWDVNRWGRGPEQPMFELTVTARPVPKGILERA
jgi:hypothetical protein